MIQKSFILGVLLAVSVATNLYQFYSANCAPTPEEVAEMQIRYYQSLGDQLEKYYEAR